MFLSIIIPMYNSAPFIERCLLSCINQDLPREEYEIIIIDDGSSDNCAIIASNVLKEHNNHRIIHQDNKGLSVARNVGLGLAEGDYIWFVDSDDTIQENCLGFIKQTCESSSCDILSFCAASVSDGQVKRLFSREDGRICPGREYICVDVFVCAQFSIYQRQFLILNSLNFVPGIFHEDSEFTPRAYYEASNVISSNRVLYYLYQHPGSITSTPNLQRSQDIFNVVLKNLDSFYADVDPETRPGLAGLIATDFNYALRLGLWLDNKGVRLINEMAWENKRMLKYFRLSPLFRHKLCYCIYCLFHHRMATIYKQLQFYRRKNII